MLLEQEHIISDWQDKGKPGSNAMEEVNNSVPDCNTRALALHLSFDIDEDTENNPLCSCRVVKQIIGLADLIHQTTYHHWKEIWGHDKYLINPYH